MISDFEPLSAAQVVAHRTASVCLVSGFYQAGPPVLAPCLPKPQDVGNGLWARRAISISPVPHRKTGAQVSAPESGSEAPLRGTTQLSGREDFVFDLYVRDVAAALRSAFNSAENGCTSGLFDDYAREQLVLGALRDVVRIAMDYRGMGLPVADLINEGNIGLIRAAELYDPGRCVRFGHYARPWIRVQMQRALSYQAWPVNLPADFAWRHGKVCRTEQALKASLDHPPRDSEIADACGMGVRTIHRLRATPAPTFVSLDAPFPADEPGVTLAEVIPDENTAAPDAEAERQCDRRTLLSLMKILPAREHKVLRMRYGLDDGRPRTLQEVASVFGYVRQGIHRLENAALRRLQKHARFQLHSPKTRDARQRDGGRGGGGGRGVDRVLQACPARSGMAQCASPLLAG